MTQRILKFYQSEILNDVNVSVILPFYKKFDAFVRILPLNAAYFQRNGIEVIVVLDEPSEEKQLLLLVSQYPLINWILLINRDVHAWRNPAKAINVGIRAASKKYIMVCSPESFFKTDVILRMRLILDAYKNAFAIGKVYFSTYGDYFVENKASLLYGSIMAQKSHLVSVGCYKETYDSWGGEDDNIRAKLEYKGYKKMVVDCAVLIHFDESISDVVQRDSKPRSTPADTYRESHRPTAADLLQEKWGKDFSEKIFDYKDDKEQ